jgi:hypothetical protein
MSSFNFNIALQDSLNRKLVEGADIAVDVEVSRCIEGDYDVFFDKKEKVLTLILSSKSLKTKSRVEDFSDILLDFLPSYDFDYCY